jgi:hypothetical protein
MQTRARTRPRLRRRTRRPALGLRATKECAPRTVSTYEQESVFAGDTPTTRAKHAHVLAACGRTDEAREVLGGLLAHGDEQQRVTGYEIAVIYALLHDKDNAFRWLAEPETERTVGFTFAGVDPHLDNLRSDPRFLELLKRTQNPLAAQLEAESVAAVEAEPETTGKPRFEPSELTTIPLLVQRAPEQVPPPPAALARRTRPRLFRHTAAVLLVALLVAVAGAFCT